jgi:hypothetical protein
MTPLQCLFYIQCGCEINTMEIIMFKTIIQTSIRTTVIAACVLASNPAYAHPEMDAWGRDITSGPLPAMIGPQTSTATGDKVYAGETSEITGSISLKNDCIDSLTKICPTSATRKMPVRVRPDQ